MGDAAQSAWGSNTARKAGDPVSRSVLLASADSGLRQRLRLRLTELRWSVHEAGGGAEAMAQIEAQHPEVLLLDHWLPDLDAGELELRIPVLYPALDLLRMDGDAVEGARKSPRRHELRQALHEALEAGDSDPSKRSLLVSRTQAYASEARSRAASPRGAGLPEPLPGLVGRSPAMLELGRLIRLVAPRSTSVLIEGETGTGKEIVAHALYRLSTRSARPFVILNCAAIPETLLEAELFGHARGAFTGAVGARVGRIEAAHGGTLFLDEIGEMPLALQSKMLRFLECGELQRVGENEITRVDVRVISATHQHLEQKSSEGLFRLDLYHRLAVFPLDVPALRERREDIELLAEHFLRMLASDSSMRQLSAEAHALLQGHSWPGNVRELSHVLERAVILCGDTVEIGAEHIRYRRRERA